MPRQLCLLQGDSGLVDDVRVPQLPDREVHRDVQIGVARDLGPPAREVGARGLQHPCADLLDQARVLRDRNEQRRRDRTERGRRPAQQRFDADDLLRAHRENRLIVQRELAVVPRLAELAFEVQTGCHEVPHVLVEDGNRVATASLAWYIAVSASRNKVSTLASPPGSTTAIPMLTVA